MFLTSDGDFVPTPPISFDAKGRPSLSGRLIVAIDGHRLDKLKRASLNGHATRSFVVLGRSGHAQMGLELERTPGEEIVFLSDSISVPITIRALGPVREPWLDTMLDLFAKGRRVRVGRILAFEDSAPLPKADVESLIHDELIAIEGDFRVNEDGSLRVYLDPSVFVHDTLEFAEDGVREQILVHSRMAIQKYQDYTKTETFTLKSQALVVTGIRLSTGPFPALVRPELGGGIRHIRSGVFLDGFRSTRIDRRYGASGVRQIELFNDSDIDHKLGPANFVDVEILPLLPDGRDPLGVFSRKTSRVFYHRHGVSLAGVIDLAKPRVQNALFDKISRSPSPSTYFARILTPNGLTNIPWAATPRFQHAKTEKGIESVLGTRELIPATAPISAALRKTVDHGRVFISHALPAADELFWLRELGIRAFIFKDVIRPPGNANGAYPNVFMNGHLHETIHQLSLDGVAFTQVFSNGAKSETTTEIRDYFKGFWCHDNAKMRSESVTTLINMYGWHKSHLLVHSETEIERMLERIGALVGTHTVGVMHGKGPGFMWLADSLARKLGMLSMGVGIDVEKIGQQPNFLPDFVLDFVSHERAYRQKVMDQLGLIKLFNLGGYGTLEEAAITVCSYKLFESVPAPIIFVDESAGKELSDGDEKTVRQNFWENLRRQAGMISKVSKVSYPSGETADLSTSPFGTAWMVNVIHCVSSYKSAADIICNFITDPLGYWLRAGITFLEVDLAIRSYQRRLDYYGFELPAFLQKAEAQCRAEL